MIFLPIKSVLFVFSNMTIVSVSHPFFFLADLVVLTMHVMSLTPADISVFDFAIYPVVLIIKPLIYFGPARVILCKTAILGH